jgi:hypothetical protein
MLTAQSGRPEPQPRQTRLGWIYNAGDDGLNCAHQTCVLAVTQIIPLCAEAYCRGLALGNIAAGIIRSVGHRATATHCRPDRRDVASACRHTWIDPGRQFGICIVAGSS